MVHIAAMHRPSLRLVPHLHNTVIIEGGFLILIIRRNPSVEINLSPKLWTKYILYGRGKHEFGSEFA